MLVGQPVQQRLALGELVGVARRRVRRRARRRRACSASSIGFQSLGRGAHVVAAPSSRSARTASRMSALVSRSTSMCVHDSSERRRRRRRSVGASSVASPSSSPSAARRTRRIGCTTRWTPRLRRSSAIVSESTRNGMSSITTSITVCPCAGRVHAHERLAGRAARAEPPVLERGAARARRPSTSRGRRRRAARSSARTNASAPARIATRATTLRRSAPSRRRDGPRRRPYRPSSVLIGTFAALPYAPARWTPPRPWTLALELADLADAHHDGAVPRARSQGRDEARPHAGERGRRGGRAGDPRAARGRDRPRRARRGVRDRRRRATTTPSSAGSSTPSTAPRATCAGVPIWATLIGLERAGELVVGVASAPALGMRWWAGRGLGAFRDGERDHACRRSPSLDDAQLSFAWDTAERFHADGIGDKLLDARRTGAGGRAASATSGSTCSSPKARSTSRSTRSSRSGTSPRSCRSSKKPAGGGHGVDGRTDVERRQLRVHERSAARRRASRRSRSLSRRRVGASPSGSTSARRR